METLNENLKKATFRIPKPVHRILTAAATMLAVCLTAQLLTPLVSADSRTVSAGTASNANAAIMDRYDTYINNSLADALAGLQGVERPKNYWLSDENVIAPEPDPECYGSTDDPSTLQWLLDAAQEKLGLTDTVFSTDVELYEGSVVNYYLDDTILCITWQQVIDDGVYTFSEVKIAHASQFRRFLADGTYGSEKQYYTTEMAATVNAVTASSGDFYKYRYLGVIVYNGQVQRANSEIDTCYIDEQGNLLFTKAGVISSKEEAQAFVEENNVRFSLAFGPILVQNGENVTPAMYRLGESFEKYSRAAIAQMGELHYLMLAVNRGVAPMYQTTLTIGELGQFLYELGAVQAYALDGGQTASIVTNNVLINRPDFGTQRKISDIIYFATAIPSEEWQNAQ